MTECLVEKSVGTSSDMEKIRAYTRKDFDENDIYIFNISLCNNDIDRDFEKFSLSALNELKELFLGKTGIADHSMKSSDQMARIFDTYVEKQEGRLTADGEQLYCLKAKAYMIKNDKNKSLIDDIDGGIKKEVSVSCSMAQSVCSICGQDKRSGNCSHINGRHYESKLCFSILSNATDAYEFSFVAVPAQREAGVTKSFCKKGDNAMTNVIKAIKDCEDSITLTKSQALDLASTIDSLQEDAKIGEEYKKSLAKEVTGIFVSKFPALDISVVASVVSVMTTKELLSFCDGVQKSEKTPQTQLAAKTNKKQNRDFSQFRI